MRLPCTAPPPSCTPLNCVPRTTLGLDSVPVGTFSYYDHVLDTAVLLGALPERVHGIDDELDRCCATARGTKVVPAERLWVNPDCGLETRGAEECWRRCAISSPPRRSCGDPARDRLAVKPGRPRARGRPGPVVRFARRLSA